MNLNIVIVNDFAHVNGGASEVAVLSAISLAKQGYAVTFFAAVPPIDPELKNYANVKIICMGQYDILKDPNRFRAAVQGIWNFSAARSMAQLLDTLIPSNTIIHLHSWTKSLSSSIVRVAIKKGFKVLCTMHDYCLACPNGGFFNYPKNEICHLSPLSAKCIMTNCDVRNYPQKLWRVSRQVVQKYLGFTPDGIKDFIAVSDFSKAILETFLPKNARIYTVNNPIDVSKSDPVSVHRNNFFVYVGRLSREKGPHLFAKAASILGLNAIFIGDGPLRDEISSICPSAEITGWLPRKEVYRLLNSARALIFPSLCYETQGLVVLKAAAMGVPVIVSNTSAARDLVADGLTGLWFKSGDLNDLIMKIQVLQNPDIAKKMGQMAYERYWQNPLTIDRHISQLEECYKKVLEIY
ncbi:MAG: glycosyltransferase family 4 protein [candidate division WOR-3 bacterium]